MAATADVGSEDRGGVDGSPRQPAWMDFVHTGPGTLAGRLLRRFWQPVYRSDDLKPGRAVPVRLMGEEFTLFRGASGRAYLLGPRCAHRRTRLWTGWVEGEAVRCLYHGWKYDAGGQCIEQPAEDPAACAGVRVPSYPTYEYLGLVFAYVGEGEPPAVPRYPFLEIEGELSVTAYERPTNFFYNVENGLDLVHVAFTHRQADPVVPRLEPCESDFGITTRCVRGDGRVQVFEWGFPNVNCRPPAGRSGFITSPEVAYRVPIDDEHHMGFVLLVHQFPPGEEERFHYRMAERAALAERMGDAWDLASAVLRGERTIDELLEHPNIFNIEDDTTQVGQLPLAERQYERLGRSDVGIALLRSIYQRELRALAEGRPLKHWRIPADLLPRQEPAS